MERFSLGVDVGSRRVRVGRSVFPPELVKHQFSVVCKLKAEPVPSDLCRVELIGKEFVVHPARATDRDRLSVQLERAAGLQARKCNVVGGVALASPLLADAVFAIDHRLLFGWSKNVMEN